MVFGRTLAAALLLMAMGLSDGAQAQSQATKTGTGKPAGNAADETREGGISVNTAVVAGIVVAASVGISLSAFLGGGSSPSGTK